MRESIFEHLFVRYGAGADIVKKIAATSAWNLVAWALILIGTLAWVLFFIWNPAG